MYTLIVDNLNTTLSPTDRSSGKIIRETLELNDITHQTDIKFNYRIFN